MRQAVQCGFLIASKIALRAILQKGRPRTAKNRSGTGMVGFGLHLPFKEPHLGGSIASTSDIMIPHGSHNTVPNH